MESVVRRETDIETAVLKQIEDYVAEIGVFCAPIKLSAIGRRGWPDRVFFWEGGNVLFVEFKRPGEEPRKMQLYVHRILRKMGFEVQVHDDVDTAVEFIKARIHASTIADEGDAPRRERSWFQAISEAGPGQDSSSSEDILSPEVNRHGGLYAGDSPPPRGND
jgi:hypothetical protein